MIKKFLSASVYVLGAFLVFGVIYQGLLQSDDSADDEGVERELVFGKKDSSITVYLFTDWKCPACHHMEPQFEQMAPKIMEKAKLIFIDFPIHAPTKNYIPYNLSFMINNKDKYLQLRKALAEMSISNDAPTAEQIEALANRVETTYKPLSATELNKGSLFFTDQRMSFKLNQTPSLVVLNDKDDQKEILTGSEITEKAVLDAIEKLSKPQAEL
jgi:hypothetical protein